MWQLPSEMLPVKNNTDNSLVKLLAAGVRGVGGWGVSHTRTLCFHFALNHFAYFPLGLFCIVAEQLTLLEPKHFLSLFLIYCHWYLVY